MARDADCLRRIAVGTCNPLSECRSKTGSSALDVLLRASGRRECWPSADSYASHFSEQGEARCDNAADSWSVAGLVVRRILPLAEYLWLLEQHAEPANLYERFGSLAATLLRRGTMSQMGREPTFPVVSTLRVDPSHP